MGSVSKRLRRVQTERVMLRGARVRNTREGRMRLARILVGIESLRALHSPAGV